MEMKSGRICSPILLVKVWPSLMSFWRNPSARWPKTSWKKTAAARARSASPDRHRDRRAALYPAPSVSLHHRLNAREDVFIVRRVLRIEPIEIRVAIDVHAVRRFALHVQFEPVVHLAEGQLGAFACSPDTDSFPARVKVAMEFSTAGDLLNAAVYLRTRSSQGLRSTLISTRGPTEVAALRCEKSGAAPSAVCTCTCWLVLL